jgi:hypothetical protein
MMLSVLVPAVALAAGGGPVDPPSYGIYYDRREPSFYTGFAPRTSDPGRLHLHIGRGNKLGVTVVLADDVLEEYARDLEQRWKTYRTLIDSGRLVPTQNRAFDEFEQRLNEVDLELVNALLLTRLWLTELDPGIQQMEDSKGQIALHPPGRQPGASTSPPRVDG